MSGYLLPKGCLLPKTTSVQVLVLPAVIFGIAWHKLALHFAFAYYDTKQMHESMVIDQEGGAKYPSLFSYLLSICTMLMILTAAACSRIYPSCSTFLEVRGTGTREYLVNMLFDLLL